MVKFLGIEGGGTTWVVVIAQDSPENIVERAEFETKDPHATLAEVRGWFSTREYDAVGVATFGPVDASTESRTYGYITATPKPGWRDTDVSPWHVT